MKQYIYLHTRKPKLCLLIFSHTKTLYGMTLSIYFLKHFYNQSETKNNFFYNGVYYFNSIFSNCFEWHFLWLNTTSKSNV